MSKKNKLLWILAVMLFHDSSAFVGRGGRPFLWTPSLLPHSNHDHNHVVSRETQQQPPIHQLPVTRTTTTTRRFLQSTSKSQEGNKSKKRPASKKKKPKKPKKKHTNNFRRRDYNNDLDLTRPIITNYKDNILQSSQRATSETITCEHYNECPGCVVKEKVTRVDIIQSAKKYFASPAIARKCLTNKHNSRNYNNPNHATLRNYIRDREQDDDYDSDDENDGDEFYKVVVPSPIDQWRTQAKLVAAPASSSWERNDGCVFGLYKKGSHDIISIPNCIVHHPSINKAIEVLQKATKRVGTAAYEEKTREGYLRYIQCQVERTTNKVSLTLIWHADQYKDTQPALSRLVKTLTKLDPDLWHSIWVHCNDTPYNNIFSKNPKKWHRVFGPEFLREPLPIGNQGWLYFTPLTFRQGNMDGFDILATDVAKAVPPGSAVCELYAGVGILGLSALTHHAKTSSSEPLRWLRCSDENPSNPRCFYRAVDSLPLDIVGGGKFNPKNKRKKEENDLTIAELAQQMQQGKDIIQSSSSSSDYYEDQKSKTSYMAASASAALQSGQALGANVLIVDPPRKGLEPDVLMELCKSYNPDQPTVDSLQMLAFEDRKINWANDVQTLIYVSCGFDALARDCEQLLKSEGSGWMLQSATGYLLFPGSDHIETVCIFQRK